jgi:DNA-binding phage protein
MMTLTRGFKTTVLKRLQREPGFREAMLKEGIDAMFAGDMESGKAILRDYIRASLGFAELEDATRIPSRTLMRMLGPKGNPRANDLFLIISCLQSHAGVRLAVEPHRPESLEAHSPE